MFKKLSGMLFFAAILTIAGCATTGPSHQADIDALNARITALQGQLAEKDAEIAKMSGEIKEEANTRAAAEAALARAEEEKRALLVVSKKKTQETDSDLK